MKEACPKCGTPKRGDACPKCGLVFSKFDPKVLGQKVPETLKKMWQTVEEDWDDRARHALFVERALAAGSPGFAARCYREREEDATAKEQLKRIEERLQQVMVASQTKREGRLSGRKLALGILLLFITIIFLYGLYHRV